VRSLNKQRLEAVGNGKLLIGTLAPCIAVSTDFQIDQIPAVPVVFLR